jgi:amidase
MEVTLPVTMAGLPALSVPAGFGGPHKLPMGMQIVGPACADLDVLRVGHAYELASPWIGQTVSGAIRS